MCFINPSCNKNPNFHKGEYLFENNDFTPCEKVGDLIIIWPEDKDVNEQQKVIIRKLVNNMVKVEGGTFMMGAQNNDPQEPQYDANAMENESPVHQVTLSDYYINKYEVTQEEWETLMGYDMGWQNIYGKGNNIPAYNISYNEAQQFVQLLSKLTRMEFCLPTEAQWEFAARGGKKSQFYHFSGSNDVNAVAWHKNNTDNILHNVGEKQANELGLYDMSGNLWEWCFDSYYEYPTEPSSDPWPQWGEPYVLRGGSWTYLPAYCRVTARDSYSGDAQSVSNGFRVALKVQ